MALGSTQPLTEMITGGKCGRCVRLTTLPTSCAVVMKSGNLNFLEPSGPFQACKGTALTYIHAWATLHSTRFSALACLQIFFTEVAYWLTAPLTLKPQNGSRIKFEWALRISCDPASSAECQHLHYTIIYLTKDFSFFVTFFM